MPKQINQHLQSQLTRAIASLNRAVPAFYKGCCKVLLAITLVFQGATISWQYLY
ncbi:hypothetical protein ACQFX9_18375 [Aliinostoc sp. HNIBRCY26]|uniref:hypothetical protein n=1 Tax=Aliinostoc sp. HNIBRCY26 TaxID=3418997 RepID=UPI003D093672